MKNLFWQRGQTPLVIILAVLFSTIYLFAARMDHQSYIITSDPGIEAIFRARILIPILYKTLFPTSWIDAAWFRWLVSSVYVSGILMVVPFYTRRLLGADHARVIQPLVMLSVMLILMMHYVASQVLNVYYCYDMPAILFYLVGFVLLTSETPRVRLYGVLAVILFAFSRETVSVAVFHALALYLWQNRHLGWRCCITGTTTLMAALVIVIAVIHWGLVHAVGGANANTMFLYEHEKLRFVANAYRVLHERGSTAQLVIVGGGILFWLPLFWRALTPELRILAYGSLIPLTPLLFAGNFTELRIYGELVPLMAVMLATIFHGLIQKDQIAGD